MLAKWNSLCRSLCAQRWLSTQTSTIKKLSAMELQHMYRKAYDYPSGLHAEQAGFDIVLVGDSLGMVVLGYDTTQPVTMEEMIHHCKATRRGASSRFIVGDMPFGSYEAGPHEALANARRLVKEAHVDAVKIEGGNLIRVESVNKLVESGIPVMGHVGLTPQRIGVLGGFRAQGRTAVKAREIVDEALALQQAGAFAIVIECVPSIVAEAVTRALKIPTIGIGAGPHTSGQVLVYHDLLGITHHPHHAQHVPKFCKKYAEVGIAINSSLMQYKHDILNGNFPLEEHCPYRMTEEEMDMFHASLDRDKTTREAQAISTERKLRQQDEYEKAQLY